MNKNKKSLDEYFDQARSIPPLISKNEARLFLERNINEYTTVIEPRPLYQNKKFYIAGAAMATIALIIFFVTSIFNHFDRQSVTTPQNFSQNQKAQMTSDSTKEKSNQKSIDSENKFTSSKQLSKTEIDLTVKEKNVDQKKKNPNVSFASWTPEKIQGIRIFTLDSSGLAKFGIRVLSNGYIEESWGSSMLVHIQWKQLRNKATRNIFPDIKFFKSKDTTAKTVDEHQNESTQLTITKQKNQSSDTVIIHSVLLTNNKGRRFFSTDGYGEFPIPDFTNQNKEQDPSSSKVSFKIFQNLIPIRVNKPFDPENIIPNDDEFYIYWFERTPEFIAALPESIQKIILSDNETRTEEQHQILVKNQNEIPKQLETTVYPNPVSNSTATLKYTLPEKSSVAVSLYNIEGQRLKEFSATEQREKGKWEEHLSLGDLQAGMYLLAVMTDKGEQSVQRIMVLK